MIKGAITEDNIAEYIKENYCNHDKMIITSEHTIEDMIPLKQEDYGLDCDCTLTSITEQCIYYCENRLTPEIVYPVVEHIAKHYLYNGKNFGTLPIFVNTIFRKSMEQIKERFLPNLEVGKFKSKYFKNCFFNDFDINILTNKEIPVILNLWNDGRDYYKIHSINIVGYRVYDGTLEFLKVHDNWEKEVRFVDFKRLSKLSTINWRE